MLKQIKFRSKCYPTPLVPHAFSNPLCMKQPIPSVFQGGCKNLWAKFGMGTSGPCHSLRIFFSQILSANACTLFQPLFLFLLEAWIRARSISPAAFGSSPAEPDAALSTGAGCITSPFQVFNHDGLLSIWIFKSRPHKWNHLVVPASRERSLSHLAKCWAGQHGRLPESLAFTIPLSAAFHRPPGPSLHLGFNREIHGLPDMIVRFAVINPEKSLMWPLPNPPIYSWFELDLIYLRVTWLMVPT